MLQQDILGILATFLIKLSKVTLGGKKAQRVTPGLMTWVLILGDLCENLLPTNCPQTPCSVHTPMPTSTHIKQKNGMFLHLKTIRKNKTKTKPTPPTQCCIMVNSWTRSFVVLNLVSWWIFNPSMQEAWACGSLWVQGQPGPQSETLHDYIFPYSFLVSCNLCNQRWC